MLYRRRSRRRKRKKEKKRRRGRRSGKRRRRRRGRKKKKLVLYKWNLNGLDLFHMLKATFTCRFYVLLELKSTSTWQAGAETCRGLGRQSIRPGSPQMKHNCLCSEIWRLSCNFTPRCALFMDNCCAELILRILSHLITPQATVEHRR